jgi:hypothetical protein
MLALGIGIGVFGTGGDVGRSKGGLDRAGIRAAQVQIQAAEALLEVAEDRLGAADRSLEVARVQLVAARSHLRTVARLHRSLYLLLSSMVNRSAPLYAGFIEVMAAAEAGVDEAGERLDAARGDPQHLRADGVAP